MLDRIKVRKWITENYSDLSPKRQDDMFRALVGGNFDISAPIPDIDAVRRLESFIADKGYSDLLLTFQGILRSHEDLYQQKHEWSEPIRTPNVDPEHPAVREQREKREARIKLADAIVDVAAAVRNLK